MTPLVLLHGFSGAPAAWDSVIAMLPGAVEVVRPAVGGHDGVPPPTSFDDEVDRLARIVRESGLAAPHLCGYSLGGRLAMGLLARHAALFSGATLVGANVSLPVEQRRAREEQDERWATMIEHEGIDAFVARWEAQALFSSQASVPASARAAQRAQRLRHDPLGLAGAMRALSLARMPAYEAALPALDLSIRLVTGGLDEKFTRVARELCRALQRGEHVIVEGAGHNVVLEQPGRLASVLERALA